jgi:hypothetical protein
MTFTVNIRNFTANTSITINHINYIYPRIYFIIIRHKYFSFHAPIRDDANTTTVKTAPKQQRHGAIMDAQVVFA